MLLVSTENIPGKNYEALGLVKGATIQSKNIGRDIGSSFKTLIGGELKSYTEMMNEARALATKRMVEEAESLDEALAVLTSRETAAVLADPRGLDLLAALNAPPPPPHRRATG